MSNVDAFANDQLPRQVVQREKYEQGECRRFHLLFAYREPERQRISSGEQVLLAPDIAQAAARLAHERGVNCILIRKRFYAGKPASAADVIDTFFDIRAPEADHA